MNTTELDHYRELCRQLKTQADSLVAGLDGTLNKGSVAGAFCATGTEMIVDQLGHARAAAYFRTVVATLEHGEMPPSMMLN